VAIPASYRFPAAISSVALSGDGKRLAAAVRSEVVLVEVDEAAAAPRRVPTDCDLLTHVEFSPDAAMVAAAGGQPGRHGEVRFLRSADGGTVATRRSGNDTLFRGNFSPDGKLLAVGGADGAVHLIPVDPASEIRRFDLHTDWVMDVAFAPDGKTFVSGGRDKATKISDGATGTLLRAVDASPDIITSVTTDGVFAVSAGRARTLMSYEYKIALSGVGVTGAGNGAQPITKRDQYTKAFEGQPAEVLDMAASGDRKLVAVAGGFGEVRVYRIADRQRIAAVPNVPAPIYSLALDQTGTRLAVGSKGGQVLVYELPGGKLLRTISPVPVQTASAAATAGDATGATANATGR
jgi:WD40 repeat protein